MHIQLAHTLSLSVYLSLSLSLSLTHTLVHSYTRTHTHIRTHFHTHTPVSDTVAADTASAYALWLTIGHGNVPSNDAKDMQAGKPSTAGI
jgi:hypothetical protein